MTDDPEKTPVSGTDAAEDPAQPFRENGPRGDGLRWTLMIILLLAVAGLLVWMQSNAGKEGPATTAPQTPIASPSLPAGSAPPQAAPPPGQVNPHSDAYMGLALLAEKRSLTPPDEQRQKLVEIFRDKIRIDKAIREINRELLKVFKAPQVAYLLKNKGKWGEGLELPGQVPEGKTPLQVAASDLLAKRAKDFNAIRPDEKAAADKDIQALMTYVGRWEPYQMILALEKDQALAITYTQAIRFQALFTKSDNLSRQFDQTEERLAKTLTREQAQYLINLKDQMQKEGKEFKAQSPEEIVTWLTK